MKALENSFPLTAQQKIARHVMIEISKIRGCAIRVRPEDIPMDRETFFTESPKLLGQKVSINSKRNGKTIIDRYEIFEDIVVCKDLNFVVFATGKAFIEFSFRMISGNLRQNNFDMNTINWN